MRNVKYRKITGKEIHTLFVNELILFINELKILDMQGTSKINFCIFKKIPVKKVLATSILSTSPHSSININLQQSF